MNNIKEIRRRIKSIGNTRKITRAMEMVSAAKMRRAVESVLKVREYASSAWNVLNNLARAFERNAHEIPLLEVRKVKKILMIVVMSNRGLCGSFNSQIIKRVKEQINDPSKLKINRGGRKRVESDVPDDKLEIDFVTIGRRGENAIRKLGKKIIATFPDLTYLPSVSDVRPLAKVVIDDYLEKKYDKVVVVYTDYISTMKQETKIRQLLPISWVDLEKQITEMDALAKEYDVKKLEPEYKVEPSPNEVLDYVFPRLIEMQIYHAILESNASKESARMMAMRNATEAAGEMAEDLTMAYNQLRQMKITQEIAEISAGKAALED